MAICIRLIRKVEPRSGDSLLRGTRTTIDSRRRSRRGRRARSERCNECGREKSNAAGTPSAPQATPPPALLVGESEHRLYVLTPENVEYIEAQGNYVKLHASGADYISRASIKRLATTLADRGFLRSERSYLFIEPRCCLPAAFCSRTHTWIYSVRSTKCLSESLNGARDFHLRGFAHEREWAMAGCASDG